MISLTQKLLLTLCLATGLSSVAQAQFSFPYTATLPQQTANPAYENRSIATESVAQPVAKHERKSHKKVMAH
jgi:hypothetical protein